VSENSHLGDTPRVEELIGSVKVMLDAYNEGHIDRLYLANNVFVNTMTQNPAVEQLLPVVGDDSDEELKHHWDYIYEPDARTVMDGLLMRYIESLVYQGLVENIACEMAARMVAMKAASDNARSSTNYSWSITRPARRRLPRNCRKLSRVLQRFNL